MGELYYTAQQEWVRLEDGLAFVGHTGKGLTGDIVYIELPQRGQHVDKDEACAGVEAVKSVVEVHAPLCGVVRDINETVFDDPDIIAKQPMETWLFSITPDGRPDLCGLTASREYNRE